ncbi:MAG TPA: ribonuclease E/G, partial [Rhodospirillaceae bacterium]|nr:ribonuclease E/G [Rhodospirillaceae bacterium]
NPTEALVAIDVNSGRSTRERNVEQTAYRTNLEAADEVARQLRLRDLAGLIVVDFIDMDISRNNHAVERRLKDAMKSDRARIQIGRISPFGLLELSRQRLRPSLLEAHTQICPVCNGTGVMRSTESTSMVILRELEEEGLRKRAREVTVTTQTDVALYLLNQKRGSLQDLEIRYGFKILVLADSGLAASDYEITHIRHDGEEGVSSKDEEKAEDAGVKRRRSRGRRSTPDDGGGDAQTEEADNGEKYDDEDEEGRKRVGRRRGRRGGRRRRKADSDGETESDNEVSTETKDPAPDQSEEEDEAAGRRRRRRRRGRRGRGGSDETAVDQKTNDKEISEAEDDAERPVNNSPSLNVEIDIPEPSADHDDKDTDTTSETDSEQTITEGVGEEVDSTKEEVRPAVEETTENDRPRRSGWWNRSSS